MDKKKWMIYGANGYSGELITRLARKVGLRPVLAGRNQNQIENLAKSLGLESAVFALDDVATVTRHLAEMELVLHCAGPYVKTAEPMVKAAIAAKTHYVDITGEIPAYELIHDYSDAAKDADIMLLPGSGFDIVPTDCVAAFLKEKMPKAEKLHLSFQGLGGISAGTLKSALGQMGSGSKIRKNGKLENIPFFSLRKEVSFAGELTSVYSIPWGDVYTAFFSTKIPNIEVYTEIPVPEFIADAISQSSGLQSFLGSDFIVNIGQSLVDAFVDGPDEKSRRTGKTIVIGEVWDAAGNYKKVRLTAKEGYSYTFESALASVRRILKGDFKPGFQTPSLAYGWKFALDVAGTDIREMN